MLQTIRRCLRMLPPVRLASWALMIPLAAAAGALEAGAAAAVFALIAIVNDPSRAGTLPVARTVVRFLPSHSPRGVILGFTAIVVVYHVVKNLAVVASQYARHHVEARTKADLSTRLMRGYLAAPYARLAARHADDLRRATTELPLNVCEVLSAAATLLNDALSAVGLAVVLARASPRVSLLAGGAVALLLAATLRATRTLAFSVGRAAHELKISIERSVHQAFGSLKELKVLGRERHFAEEFDAKQRTGLRLRVLATTLASVPPVVVETCVVVGALLVIALVTVTGASGPDGLALLGVFTYAGFRVVPLVNRVTWRMNAIRSSAAPVAELYADFVAVEPFAHARFESADRGGAEWRELTLDHVAFRYDSTGPDVLRDVSLRLRRGESLGIAGATGAGKTTLVDVLLGVLSPVSGRVLVDGVERSTSVRGPRAAYVPQSVFVADDTLARNVAFGMPETEIDPRRLLDAIETAQLSRVLHGLPDGVATTLGERGARLSGGERQRVGIARALYHQPDVLVLDEATSALDSATEADLFRAIEGAPALTVVIVAHRLSTLRGCDRLAVIAGGRIVASGAFDELLHTSPEFRRLAAAAELNVGEIV